MPRPRILSDSAIPPGDGYGRLAARRGIIMAKAATSSTFVRFSIVGAVGYLVRDNLPTLEKIAGVLLVIMGLNLVGVIRIPWLYRTYQLEFRAAREPVRES